EIGVTAGAKPLDRGVDDARVEFPDALPGKALAVEDARSEILDHHIAAPDQLLQYLLAAGRFEIDRDRALVRVEHREIEAVGALHVLQLAAGDVAAPRHLNLDHIGAHPREELGRGWRRLDVTHIEDAHTFQSFAHFRLHLN